MDDTTAFHCQSTTMDATDPLLWLQQQPSFPKVLWREKGEETIRAASGVTLWFTHVPTLSPTLDPNVRLYGGMHFFPKTPPTPLWDPFPPLCFWLPHYELSCQGSHTLLRRYGTSSLSLLSPPSTPRVPRCLGREDLPSFSDWEKMIRTTTTAIQSGLLHKLVLARKTTLSFSSPLSPFLLLKPFLDTPSRESTLFAFQWNPSTCFLGVTPELLFKREGTLLISEALAGTKPRGITTEEDTKQKRALLTGKKEKEEFVYVKQALEQLLLPLSTSLQWEGKDRLLSTSHTHHIYNRLQAQIPHALSLQEIVSLLHPTPALGGYPRSVAPTWIQKLEPFQRGWYGAPIGVISPRASAFYAAIRSALIKQEKLHLFTGLGVVKDSDPQQEWEELNTKLGWCPYLPLWLGD